MRLDRRVKGTKLDALKFLAWCKSVQGVQGGYVYHAGGGGYKVMVYGEWTEEAQEEMLKGAKVYHLHIY